jgi:hypothetical protein
MSQAISRRDFFGAALAAVVLPVVAQSASPGPKRLVARTRVLEVNGRQARVFGLTGPDGRASASDPASGSVSSSQTRPARAPSSIGMDSSRPGRRMDSRGRKPPRSPHGKPMHMTSRRSREPSGCTRIKGCRSRG